MQGTRVRALVWEDPTCRRATRPVSHNYWLSLRVWSLCPATREAAIVRGPCTTMKSGPRLPQQEKALTQKRRPDTAKKKKKKRQRHTSNLEALLLLSGRSDAFVFLFWLPLSCRALNQSRSLLAISLSSRSLQAESKEEQHKAWRVTEHHVNACSQIIPIPKR